MELFSYNILTPIFGFLMFISTLKSDFKPSDRYKIVDSSKTQ